MYLKWSKLGEKMTNDNRNVSCKFNLQEKSFGVEEILLAECINITKIFI